MYRPELNSNMVPLKLLIPTYQNKKGVEVKIYPPIADAILFCGSFKSYGGTDKMDVNGIYSVEDTATVETWFIPEIKSDCRIALETGEVYEILGEPENIDRRNQFLKIKLRRVKGRA